MDEARAHAEATAGLQWQADTDMMAYRAVERRYGEGSVRVERYHLDLQRGPLQLIVMTGMGEFKSRVVERMDVPATVQSIVDIVEHVFRVGDDERTAVTCFLADLRSYEFYGKVMMFAGFSRRWRFLEYFKSTRQAAPWFGMWAEEVWRPLPRGPYFRFPGDMRRLFAGVPV